MADSKNGDFNIGRPVPATPPAAPPQAASTRLPASNLGELPGGGLSSNDTVIGIAIVLGLAILFFFVRGGLRQHLIARRASPSAAGGAGWSLFAFLLVVSVAIVFGLLGDLWRVLAFLIPMGVLILVTLVMFVVLYKSAAKGRR
jgi:hypothetical protein